MDIKKIIACGMMLGMLTGVGFAQRGKLANGGTLPGARLPNSVSPPRIHSNAPVMGSQTAGISSPKGITRTSPKGISPSSRRMPDTMIGPNAHELGNRTAVGPNY